MRTYLMTAFLLGSMLVGNLSFASINKAGVKEYIFKYILSGRTLEIKESAESYEEAFEKSAQRCFDFYRGSGKMSEERGLDIIDVCANPRK